MKIRTLRAEERPAWLELLDHWELADGWRGRDFFRRWIEEDPTYADENVFVAEESGRLVSTAQIFPRRIRLRGHEVALGGIGSVFTDEAVRGRGAARAVLRGCVDAMRERGMDVSLLFTGRVSFYSEIGWSSWGAAASVLERGEGSQRSAAAAEAFDAARDLASVRALHEAYSRERDGTVVRDDPLWTMSLRASGNPREEFVVARRQGRVVAYARAIVLYRVFVIMEMARAPDAADALADLLLAVQAPRDDDPWATAERPSAELRRAALTVDLSRDPELAAALHARGFGVIRVDDPSSMLSCLDAPRLAARIGVPLETGESPEAYLRRLLPGERFVFWQADRF